MTCAERGTEAREAKEAKEEAELAGNMASDCSVTVEYKKMIRHQRRMKGHTTTLISLARMLAQNIFKVSRRSITTEVNRITNRTS